MYILNASGQKVTAGPLDLITIVLDAKTKRYHPYFLEWHPLPGQFDAEVKDVTAVRLRSKMHHTAGFETLAEAQDHLRREIEEKIEIDPENVHIDEDRIRVMDGINASVILVENWRK